MRTGRAAEPLLVVLAAVVLSVVMTWPLASRIGTVGRVNTGDGQLSIWNVAWVARTLVVDPRHVFDANIFYPHKGALAFSEANLGAGALAVPAYWASGGNPHAAHNSVVLMAFAFSVIGAYSLARLLTGSAAGAAFAAVTFAFCPFVFARTAHIQLLMIAGLPLSLLAFHRFVDRQSPERVILLAVALVAQALCCGYYGIFAGLMVGLGVLYYAAVRRLWRRWQYWAGACAAALLAVAVIAPFFLPYLQIQQVEGGQFRSLDEARRWSANWQAYLASGGIGHRWLLPWLTQRNEVLFPGFVVSVMAAVGLGMAVGTWRDRRRGPGRFLSAAEAQTIGFYTLVAALAAWVSFGPGGGLYSVLYRLVPVFTFMRAPARFGLLVTLAFSVIGAFGFRAILHACPRPRVVGAAIITVSVAMLAQIPLPYPRVQEPPAVYRILATMPDGPVAEFPFFYRPVDFHRHCLYMLNSTVHWKPLINGYSDHIPDDFWQMVDPVSTFPSPESFAALRKLRAQYVVFHLNFYDRRSRPKLLERIYEFREHLRPLARDGDVVLYEIASFPRE